MITAPSEKRIRTLLQDLDAAALDLLIGDWLDALAATGRPEDELRAARSTGSGSAASGTARSSCLPPCSTGRR
jgi:hypothetical protein